MQHFLPLSHALPEFALKNRALVPRDEAGAPSITDVQFEALAAGVGRGNSMLCVAPTSTGKTLVGIWSALTWLTGSSGRRAVYLVTHRALARQKFDELLSLLGPSVFEDDATCVVLATGDAVLDGEGAIPAVPLEAPLLIATYEKYLAMIAGSGVRGDMTDCVIICDEVQIIGDGTRGRSVEVLLTLLKQAGWGQLVALSAVMDTTDASAVANWLGVALIKCATREKHLLYECRTTQRIHSFDTGAEGLGVQTRPRTKEGLTTVGVVRELLLTSENRPIVVFCMSVKRVDELSAELAQKNPGISVATAPLLPGFDEDTAAARELSTYMVRKVAFHTASLRENERHLVEDAIAGRRVDVVVATSTLAAGVNFPLGAVIFDRWERWDDKKRLHLPIPESEFQNMAGRAGRMGSGHERGRVIYIADGNAHQQRSALQYLDPDRVSRLAPRLEPSAFEQVTLQLLSAGLCGSEAEVYEFLLGSLSAFREREINKVGLDHWEAAVSRAVGSLREWGYVL